jgi:putative hydrolase
MAFWGDYHTHTIYSHGKGTLEENVVAAVKHGFREIAITDHGFKHFTYNVRRMDFPYMLEDAARMRKKYPMIEIYLGLETNFNSADGHVDILPSDMPNLDIIVCGYHKFVMPERFRDYFKFHFPNFWLDTFKTSSKRITAQNTDTYIKALEKYDIDIISHINYGIKVEVKAVAEACKFYGTLVELNGKRISMTDAELTTIAETGAEFICNSDAHSVDRVGNFDVGIDTIERVGIPYSQVANWERLPVLRSRKAKAAASDKDKP